MKLSNLVSVKVIYYLISISKGALVVHDMHWWIVTSIICHQVNIAKYLGDSVLTALKQLVETRVKHVTPICDLKFGERKKMGLGF